MSGLQKSLERLFDQFPGRAAEITALLREYSDPAKLPKFEHDTLAEFLASLDVEDDD